MKILKTFWALGTKRGCAAASEEMLGQTDAVVNRLIENGLFEFSLDKFAIIFTFYMMHGERSRSESVRTRPAAISCRIPAGSQGMIEAQEVITPKENMKENPFKRLFSEAVQEIETPHSQKRLCIRSGIDLSGSKTFRQCFTSTGEEADADGSQSPSLKEETVLTNRILPETKQCLNALDQASYGPSNFNCLPNELLFIILRHLPQDVLALYACRVCRKWKDIIYGALMTKMDLYSNERYHNNFSQSLASATYNNLRCLILRKCEWVTEDTFKSISRFSTTLRYLDVSGCDKITDYHLEMYISKLVKLRVLKFGAKEQNRLKPASVHFCDRITDVGVGHLSTLTNLRELSLVRCRITGNCFQQLKTLHQLEELDLEWTKITDASLVHMRHWVRLRTLVLNNCGKLTDVGVRQHIPPIASLRNLSFIRTNLTDETLHQLSRLRLERLAIYYSPAITDLGFFWISQMSTLIKFKYENIEKKNVHLTDTGFNLLSRIPNLQILKLSGLAEVTYNSLENLTSLRNLRLLDRMKESGFRRLPRSLVQLHLSGHPSVMDSALVKLLHLDNLIKLRLSDFSSITPAGLSCFTSLPKLEVLRISWCDQISVEGARSSLLDFKGKLEIAYDDDEWIPGNGHS
ncbi:hypothetical protein PROFUN_16160 [Planoprotostelium fungivorum]|uniref:F-box domain-containing protein n=1 Tax=Planoprotostelium fungivorum TaxID=1890364 RepID=A0A2P6MS79_9EUKA|nr:hypothetical protein PROFUN_16160 [Planoprotostelium fungivorum]